MTKKDTSTSWGNVADWYDNLLSGDPDSFQVQVILPNITRLISLKNTDTVLDLACGSGFFSDYFAKTGAKVIGVDIGKELIEIAKQRVPSASVSVEFHVSGAEKLGFIENKSVDKIALILAIQNIEHVSAMFAECKRVLEDNGKMFVVMNHPAYRIPKRSSWGFDEKDQKEFKQYRRIDGYLSESKEVIDMNPGKNKENKETISFHRPLQYYFKILNNNGLVVHRLEEWISHRKSDKGPRQKEEDRIRKEIPMFLCLEIGVEK